MSELFTYQFQVLESHLDTFGHVNNATYLSLYEQARWDFITKNGFGLEKIQKEMVGPVILNVQLSFKREMINREIIKVESRFREMKNKLIMIMDQKMIKEGGEVASTLSLEVGLMDMKARKLIEPHADWMNAIGVKS